MITEDRRAIEIIQLRDTERTRQGPFRTLWQETADYVFPQENQITSVKTAGEDKSRKLYDSTAVFDSRDMASGLSAAMMPGGQKFFDLTVQDEEAAEMEHVDRWLSYATEITHKELHNSNLLMQLNATLHSLVVFGNGCIFSEWDGRRLGLNFRDYPVSKYQIIENEYGLVDTVILTLMLQAHQAMKQYGAADLSQAVIEAAARPESYCNTFEFIQIVQPRARRNPQLSDKLNMPYESIVVDVLGKRVVDEGGFEEFPFAVVRWIKNSDEVYGRGQGTESLADVKMLQQMQKDLIDLGNRYGNPPVEVLDTFEGMVRMFPGARNDVQQLNTIHAIEQQALGNFPITKQIVEDQRELIHKAFFRDVFWNLGSLTGDRRTRLEIQERIQEGLQRLALPVARIQTELYKPNITRSVLLLIRNGKIPYPPPEVQGREMGIEYEGRLVLALKQQQARAFTQFVNTIVAPLAAVYPDSLDTVSFDRALPDIARAHGVKTEHLATEEEIQAKREARAKQAALAQAAQIAQTAGDVYQKGITAPQEGSPSKALVEAAAE